MRGGALFIFGAGNAGSTGAAKWRRRKSAAVTIGAARFAGIRVQIAGWFGLATVTSRCAFATKAVAAMRRQRIGAINIKAAVGRHAFMRCAGEPGFARGAVGQPNGYAIEFGDTT